MSGREQTVASPTQPWTGTRLVAWSDLGAEELEAWHRLRQSNPALDSPYFHPAFAGAVHATGADVTVAIHRDRTGAIRAILPAHRDGGTLLPAGWPGADYQAPIAAPGEPASPLDLLPPGIREIRFSTLVEPDPAYEPYLVVREPAPFIDATGGLEGYLTRATRTGKEKMSEARRGIAKATRELGPVRFEASSCDEQALAWVIAAKRAQYAATGAGDYFAPPRRRALLSQLLRTTEPGFAGMLSTVHVGDQLVAAHFGIRSGPVLHWWFPVYDPAFARIGPGWILLREMLTAAPAAGITRIDLGRGEDEYKRWLMTGATTVCQATVTRSTARRLVRQARHRAVAAMKASPLGPALRPLVRRLRAARPAPTSVPTAQRKEGTP
jgi:CelD/BcsL family acetyltransferase involved in cellulose biosynthesis